MLELSCHSEKFVNDLFCCAEHIGWAKGKWIIVWTESEALV